MIRAESSETFGAFSGCCGYGKDLRGRKGFVATRRDSGVYLPVLSRFSLTNGRMERQEARDGDGQAA